jgi:hypothetical protein
LLDISITSPIQNISNQLQGINRNQALNRGRLAQVRYNDKLNGVSNPRTISIYDSKGARVYRNAFTPGFPFGRMVVDLSKHAKGVYYIDLTDAAGVRLQSERVVVY